MTRTNWKPLLEQSPDGNLGAALVRLARQATAMHLYETTRTTTPQGDAQVRAVGDGTQQEFDAATGGRIDTEVNR